MERKPRIKREFSNKDFRKPEKKSYEGPEFIRLNKFIADAGICSRRKADDLIKEGVVKVNGKIIVELGVKVSRSDMITVKGDPIKVFKHNTYILMNKPKDCITTTDDETGRKTVMDLIKLHDRLYPVGRLDRNTTGALLITNDGELANRLIHPKYGIEKVYNARLDLELRSEDGKKISKGIELEDFKTLPCEVFIHPDDEFKVTLTIKEGKNREIKRMFEALGYKVKQLERKYFAGLTTKGIEKGQYRHLSKTEIQYLKKLVKIID